ncbi:MAG TPA: SRPBCC domain-containing protein [Rhizomicrobium sp.]
MSKPDTLSVVIEREFSHQPEKIWRALTQPHLIAEWLMKNDFAPAVGHRFNFRENYLPNGKLDCEVLTVEPNKLLSYTWGSTSDNPAFAVQNVVTFTLTPTATGTHLRVEQAGFRPEQQQAYQGAKYGWPRFLDKLDETLAKAG